MNWDRSITPQRGWFWVYVLAWVALDALAAAIILDGGYLAFTYLVMGIPGALLAFALSRSARVARWTILAVLIPMVSFVLSCVTSPFIPDYARLVQRLLHCTR